MNAKLMLVALAITACIGVYLLGDGITGLVASQSCCFGADCPVDQACRAQAQESPMPIVNTLWGGVLLLGVAVALYSIYHARRA
jgi:hypothetical protein